MPQAKGICMLLIALFGTPVFSAPHGNTDNCPEILEYKAGTLLKDFKKKANHNESHMEIMRGSISESFAGLPDCTFPEGTNATTISLVVAAFNGLFKQMNSSHPQFFSPDVFQDQTLCYLSHVSTSASLTPITYKKDKSQFEQRLQLCFAFEYYKQCMTKLAKHCKKM